MTGHILHIGYPKTGTTWFYDNFYPNINNAYLVPPELFLSGLSSPVFQLPEFDTNKKMIMVHPEMTGIRNFTWDEGQRRNMIVSNLKRLFPNATIILFIRNQLDFLISGYIYYIRKGGTYSGEEYLNRMIDGRLEFPLQYLIYNDMIESYASRFGRDNVHVYLFEEFCQDPKIFIRNFTARYGFDVSLSEINYSPVNEKLRYHLMRYMRFSNHFTKADIPVKKYFFNTPFLYKIINKNFKTLNKWKIFGRKARTTDILKPGQIDFINDYYRASNKKLHDSFGLKNILKFNYPV